MRLSNGCQIFKGHVCDTLADKHIPFGDQVECLFERNLNVVRWLRILFVDVFCQGESDGILEVLPLGVSLLHGLVVQAKVGANDFLDALSFGSLQPQVEQATLLSQEPFSELFISAVCKSANEVGDVIVLAVEHRLSHGSLL